MRDAPPGLWLLVLALLAPAVALGAPLLADAAREAPNLTSAAVAGITAGLVAGWRTSTRKVVTAANRAARRVLELHEARHHRRKEG